MLSNYDKLQLRQLLEGSYLVIKENTSEYSKGTYDIRLKEHKYLNTDYHPLNVSNQLIADIEKILEGKNVGWNNTRTTFWINK